MFYSFDSLLSMYALQSELYLLVIENSDKMISVLAYIRSYLLLCSQICTFILKLIVSVKLCEKKVLKMIEEFKHPLYYFDYLYVRGDFKVNKPDNRSNLFVL